MLVRSGFTTRFARCLSGTTAAADWKEISVFIHGIDPDELPKAHTDSYQTLLNNVNAGLRRRGQAAFGDADVVKIEWGWPSGQLDESTGAPWPDEALSVVQKNIVVEHLDPLYEAAPFDATVNPWRLMAKKGRRMFALGIGDMFYYCSPAGKRAVRDHVFGHVRQSLKSQAETSGQLSLTIFSHSAGTVIAHDMLYHLFRHDRENCHPALAAAHKLVTDNRLRIRRVYTFGSPITPLIVRSPVLMQRFRSQPQQLLDPQELGLTDDASLPGPRWVNYWCKDDVISAPVAFFYSGKLVTDKYVAVGSGPSSHTAYWASKDMANHMAAAF